MSSCKYTGTFFLIYVHMSKTLLLIQTGTRCLHFTFTRESKQDTLLLPLTSPNVDRFSKFFHSWTQQRWHNESNDFSFTTP